MKVSINTAQAYGGDSQMIPNGPEALIDAIGAQLGAIEDVEYYGSKFDGIVVAKVIECQKHANADKLSVCKIDDGRAASNVERDENGLVQVVCGAPNVRAGLLVAWLPPGTTVPTTYGTTEPFVLEARELRGVVSSGMIASASELGISDDHEGILEIDPEQEVLVENVRLKLMLGMEFKVLFELDDIVVDLENKMFTHRPDCFGVLGIARELAGIQGQNFKSPDWYLYNPQFTVDSPNSMQLNVEVKDTKNVPRFMAVVMSELTNGKSPMWMQSALARMGIRPISTIVDVTNFAMQITGQPLHAYDYDKLSQVSGQTPTLIARSAYDKEKLILLSGKELELGSKAVVIATDKGAIGLAGIMGGSNTEVDHNTTRIVLECANFDMYNIRRSAMKYGVFSDAATRFNKGQSALQNDRVIKFAMDMLADLCGAKTASQVFDIKNIVKTYKPVTLTDNFVNMRLGSSLTADEIAEILNRTELASTVEGSEITVTPPFWRTDIELPEDIVEEVGRLYGFDKLPVALPRRKATVSTSDSGLEIKSRIRGILSSAGANEILTYNFVHGNLLDTFGQQREKALQLSNALSPDLQYYRMTLLPNVLDKVHSNIKAGFGEFALFEMGRAHNNFHLDDQDFNLPKEINLLAFVYSAEAKVAKQKNGAAYYQSQKYLDFLLKKLGIKYTLKAIDGELPDFPVTKPYDPSRSAYVLDEKGDILGMVGEIQANAAKKLKLPDYVAGFELDTDKLVNRNQKANYQPSSKYPKIEQDISLKVSAKTTYAELKSCLLKALDANKPEHTITSLEPLDIYQPESDQATKNVSFRLSIASFRGTLKSAEVNSLLDEIAKSVTAELGAQRL